MLQVAILGRYNGTSMLCRVGAVKWCRWLACLAGFVRSMELPRVGVAIGRCCGLDFGMGGRVGKVQQASYSVWK